MGLWELRFTQRALTSRMNPAQTGAYDSCTCTLADGCGNHPNR